MTFAVETKAFLIFNDYIIFDTSCGTIGDMTIEFGLNSVPNSMNRRFWKFWGIRILKLFDFGNSEKLEYIIEIICSAYQCPNNFTSFLPAHTSKAYTYNEFPILVQCDTL